MLTTVGCSFSFVAAVFGAALKPINPPCGDPGVAQNNDIVVNDKMVSNNTFILFSFCGRYILLSLISLAY